MKTKDEGMQSLPLTRVAVLEDDQRRLSGWCSCRVGRDIAFDTGGLESYCLANWQTVNFDAILLAAVVEFCDRVARRPSLGWSRQFEVRLPVHEPTRWTGPPSEKLAAALAFLTGDRWQFDFQQRRSVVAPPAQGNLEMPERSLAILPFSDGLDSLMTSALLEHQRSGAVLRVRLGSGSAGSSSASLQQPFAAVPYKVRATAHRLRESSGRSRGFKFTMLCGVAAHLSTASEIVIPESGQGALGPALVPVGHGYGDYRNHPLFAERMAEFLRALFRHQVSFSFPRLWYTKGETLRECVNLVGDKWSNTRSCWQQSRQVSVGGHRRQCGICAACMLRRLGVHGAGLRERPETYVWENLSAATFEQGVAAGFTAITPAQSEYAIAGTLHLDHLAALADSPQHSGTVQRTAGQLAAAVGITRSEAEVKLQRLLRQHAREWHSFVEALGANSFVAKWISRRDRDACPKPSCR